MKILIHIQNDNRDEWLEFSRNAGRLLIGRRTDNEIFVNDRLMARQHAAIVIRPGHVYIQDYGSPNGTYLNGRRIHRERVTGRSFIHIGSTTLTLMIEEEPRATGPRQPELEDAILEDREDPSNYLVYADWLQAQNDPRGELIAIQAMLGSRKGDPERVFELRGREALLLREHRERLLGDLAHYESYVTLEWRFGFIRAARANLTYSADIEPGELLVALLDSPSAVFLEGFSCSAPDFVSLQEVVDLLALRRRPLLHLSLGPSELNIEGLYEAIPNLETLELTAHHIGLGEPRLPRLRDLSLTMVAGWPPEPIHALTQATWPALERLTLGFGNEDAPVRALQPILDGVALPSLDELAFKDVQNADEICRALPKASVVKQLKVLRVHGPVHDRALAAMVKKREVFKNLRELDITVKHLGDAGKRSLSLLKYQP